VHFIQFLLNVVPFSDSDHELPNDLEQKHNVKRLYLVASISDAI